MNNIHKMYLFFLIVLLISVSACEGGGEVNTNFVYLPAASPAAANVVSLSWNSSINHNDSIIRYDIYGKKLGDDSYALLTNSVTTNVEIDFLDAGSTYQFYITPVDSDNKISKTGVITATTLDNIFNPGFTAITNGTTIPDYWMSTQPNSDYRFYESTYDGNAGVMRFYKTTGGSGGNLIEQNFAYPLMFSDTMVFSIRFRINSSTLAGDGQVDVSPESPVGILLNFSKSGSPDVHFRRYYNITHDANSASNGEFELVASGTWVTKSYTLADMGIASGYRMTRVLIRSTGSF